MTIHWHLGYKLKNRPYVIEGVLGQGGFGVTYKVRHLELNQDLVIKIPNPHFKQDPEYNRYIQKFIEEAQTLARLCSEPHPHIVRVNDFFEEEDNHCLVMEFVPGKTLYQLVREEGALSEEQAIQYLKPIAEALIVVHEQGIVHRDTNPLNIMIRKSHTAVLIDFGIAKNINPRTSTTLDKSGNKSFAPYEQLLNNGSREVTVDIYSLAASFYYAVTGNCPTDSLSRKITNQPVVDPKEFVSNLSDRLNEFILAGMALEPEDRPQSMREWLRLLSEGEGKKVEVQLVSEVPKKLTAEEFLDRAFDKVEEGDYKGAIEDLTKAIELDANYAAAYNNRGIARYNLGDLQGAISKRSASRCADYNKAIKLEPDAIRYTNRGIARDELGDLQEAISKRSASRCADYNQAIKLDLDNAVAYNGRGWTRKELGDLQGAISKRSASRCADYIQAIRLDPNYAHAYYNRGLAYKQQSEKKQARADFRKAAYLYTQQGHSESYQDSLNQLQELE